jgi:hypothetical protein
VHCSAPVSVEWSFASRACPAATQPSILVESRNDFFLEPFGTEGVRDNPIMTSSKVRCVYLIKFVVSEISQGHDKRIVPYLAGLARGVRVPVKDVLSASDVEEGRGSDGRTSKEKSGAVEALGDSEYFPGNGIDVVGRIGGPRKLSFTQARTRESFQKMPSRPVYLKRVQMIARLRNTL